jgi:hypothetical protein
MFSPKRIFSFSVLCIVLLCAVGCADPTGPGTPPPSLPELYVPSNSVQGVWKGDDFYAVITEDTYTLYYNDFFDGLTDYNSDSINSGLDAIVYSGTIVAIDDPSQVSGLIYLDVTTDWDGYGTGYAAVHWSDYTGTTIKLIDSYLGEGPQIPKEAVSTNFDLEDYEYIESAESFTKVNVLPGPLNGTWTATDDWGTSIVEIADIFYADIYDSMGIKSLFYSGIIAGTTDPSRSTGYIYIEYVAVTPPPYGGTPGNYYALYWKNKTANSMSLSGSGDGHGKATLQEAREEYTDANGYFTWFTDFNRIP